ncbi:MAG TPA: ComEA family DNA-binding protein [Candidatus Limnocylindrales bacterium]|nr:ComEA family DNA-binding protein [Candidatus Limnocylindrales bacterium]
MDESTAPWRVLESAPPPPAASPSSAARPWTAIALAAAAVLVGAAVWLVAGNDTGSVAVDGLSPGEAAQMLADDAARPAESTAAELVVDVQGAVVRPGVVRLAVGARVADAVEAAGGFGPRVAVDRVGRVLNLAAVLRDGDQIIVPSRDDPAGSPAVGGGPTGGAAGGPVDLNRASASELDALPGIGPVTAAKIIAAREEQPFASLDDLRARKVLGAATLEKLADLVIVR